MTPSLTHRAAHATWWSALEITARYGVQLTVMIVLARILTPSDFGLIAMLLVFTSIAGLLVNAGFGTALVQKQQTSEDDETTVFLSSVAISVAAAVALWLSAPAIATFYEQPILSPLTHLLLFVLPLAAFASVPDALLTQQLDFRSRTNAEIIASLCSGVVAILLAWRGFGVWSLAWQAITAIGMRALMLWILSGWRPRGRFNTASFRSLFGFGGYMLLANLLNTISTRMQSLLIGKLFDARTLGYYTLAQNTQEAPALFMSGVLNRVGLPVFSTVADQPEKLASVLRLSLRVAIFVFVPCMVGLAVVSKPAVVVVYGARWAPAAHLLSILAIATVFWPMHVLNLAAIGARGRSDLIFKLEVVKQIASITLIVIGSFFSVTAIAWAVLASSLIAVGINTWYSHRLFGYGLLSQMRDQTATLLLSTIAAATAWLSSHWLDNPPLALAVAIVSAAMVYACGAAFFKVTAWQELLRMLSELRSTNRTLAEPPV